MYKFDINRFKLWILAFGEPLYWLIDKSAETLLDVGSGKGLPMEMLKTHMGFKKTVGVDLFEPYIKEAKTKAIHDEYVLGDVRRMTFQDKSFDVVISLQVLEHMPKKDAWKLLDKMERIAKKQVIVATPIGEMYHPAEDANPLQLHKSTFEPQDFQEHGYRVLKFGRKSILGEHGIVHKIKSPLIRKLIFGLNHLATPLYFCVQPLSNYHVYAYKNMVNKPKRNPYILLRQTLYKVTKPFLSLILKYFPLPLDGYFLYVNPTDVVLAYTFIIGIYETYHRKVLKEIVKPGFIVCDIGAHTGIHSLYLSNLVGDKGKVISCEPDPRNFEILKRNIRFNHKTNIKPLKVAISNKNGKAKLFLPPESSTENRLNVSPSLDSSYVWVKQRTLTNLFRNLGHINVLKLDIQGMEGKIVSDIIDIIQKGQIDYLIVEFWPRGYEDVGASPHKFMTSLFNLDIKIYLLDEEKQKKIPLKRNDDYLTKYCDKIGFANLLCVVN